MKKKGISLVALVITIIVLIILTGAVISTFVEDDIIDKAKEAVKKSDYATLKEAYGVAYATKQIDVATGAGGEVIKAEALKEAAKQLGLEEDFYEEGDSIVYIGENGEISDWLLNIGISSVAEDNLDLLRVLTEAGYIYSGGYVTNVTSDKTPISDLLDTDKYELVKNAKNETNGVTTGDTIVSKETEKVVAKIVVFGDINGSGDVTVIDTGELLTILANPTTVNKADLFMYDIDGDGYVAYADTEPISKQAIGGDVIDQNRAYTGDIEIIGDDKIVAGVSKLPDVESFEYVEEYELDGDVWGTYVLTLKSEKKYNDIAEMFKPYMKKVQYKTTGNKVIEHQGDCYIMGFELIVEYTTVSE